MKKTIGLIIFIGLVGVFACTNDRDERKNDISAQENVKDWFNNTFKKSREWKQNGNSEDKLPDWDKLTYKKNDSLEIYELPLREDFAKITIPKDKSLTSKEVEEIIEGTLMRLVIIKTDSNKMFVRKLYYVPEYHYLVSKGNDLSNIMLGKNGDDFTGLLITKNWNDEVLSFHNIKEGKIDGMLVKKNKNNSTARAPINELDEVVVMNNYQKRESVFIVPPPPYFTYYPPSASYDPYGSYAGGSSSSSSSNNNKTECLNALNAMTETSGPTSQLISITTVSENNSEIINNYKWKIYSGIGFGLYSSDTGVLKRVANSNPALRKEWVSLTHNSISLEGKVVGGDVSFSTNYAQATVGKYNALMNISYNVKFALIYKDCPASSSGDYTATNTFNND